jgi:hypothetical protein
LLAKEDRRGTSGICEVAAEIGVKEVYLQRLVFSPDPPSARLAGSGAVRRLTQEEAVYLKQARIWRIPLA